MASHSETLHVTIKRKGGEGKGEVYIGERKRKQQYEIQRKKEWVEIVTLGKASGESKEGSRKESEYVNKETTGIYKKREEEGRVLLKGGE